MSQSDSAYIQVTAEYGAQSSYDPPLQEFVPAKYELSNPAQVQSVRVAVTDGGVVVAIPSTFESVTAMMLKNNGTTASVECSFNYTGGTGTPVTNTVETLPGGILVVSGRVDVDAGLSLHFRSGTTAGSTAICDIMFMGT